VMGRVAGQTPTRARTSFGAIRLPPATWLAGEDDGFTDASPASIVAHGGAVVGGAWSARRAIRPPTRAPHLLTLHLCRERVTAPGATLVRGHTIGMMGVGADSVTCGERVVRVVGDGALHDR